MWQVLDPRPLPLGTAIWIVDLGGMGLSDLGSEAFQFYKRMSVEVGMHYPERLYKYACLLRPPSHALVAVLEQQPWAALGPRSFHCGVHRHRFFCLAYLMQRKLVTTAVLGCFWALKLLVWQQGEKG